MDVNHVNDDLIEIDGKVRVERGPRTLTAVATPELLDNAVTKSHYQVGSLDANGVTIVLGQEMTYHDWLGFESNQACAFHLYVWAEFEEPNAVGDLGVWTKVGTFDSQAVAVAEGVKLLSGSVV